MWKTDIPTEREIYMFAFGPNPEPECDGAGRDAYCAMMRERRSELAEIRAKRNEA